MSDPTHGIPEDRIAAAHAAHEWSSGHRHALLHSREAACFHCLARFHPFEIEEWVDNSQTALCPRCGIDAVLGEHVSLTTELLSDMRALWFTPMP